MNSQSLRYLLVGTYNALIGLIIFYLINFTIGNIAHYLVILVLSYFLALTHAYIGQRWLVFRSKAYWINEYFRFFLVNLSGMIVNALLLIALVEYGIDLMIAQAISVLIVTVFSYFGHRNFSFKLT